MSTSAEQPPGPDVSGTYVYEAPNARQGNMVGSLSDLVKTSDSVAEVTVASESIERQAVGKGEVRELRYLELEVRQVIAGGELPTQFKLLDTVVLVGEDGSRGPGRGYELRVGSDLVVAVVKQLSGHYELNTGLGFFPANDEEQAAIVANGRIASADPSAIAIGRETAGLTTDQLVETFKAAQ